MGRFTMMANSLSEAAFDAAGTIRTVGAAISALQGAPELPMPVVTVPEGSGKYFVCSDDPEGNAAPINAFDGVILSAKYVNERWNSKYGEAGGDKAPICQSEDGVSGWSEGCEYVCKVCPYNRIGSGGGNAKACRNTARLTVLCAGETLPWRVKVPTMSVANLTGYVARVLVPAGLSIDSVVTHFSLMKAVNSTGVTYSQIMFATVGKLSEENARLVSSLSANLSALTARDTPKAIEGA